MRIVHIANFYGPRSGGIKTALHELGRGYLAAGHDFIYVVPGTRYAFERTEFGRKITLPSYEIPGSGGYRIIKNNRVLREYLECLKPDCIEVSDRFTLSSVGKWAKRNGVPSVVFSHETLRGLANRFLPTFFPKRALVNFHNRFLASRFDRVIATTNFAAAEFREIGVKNLELVPLGVDLFNFSPYHRSVRLRHTLAQGADLLLVHCGRLSPEKEPQRSIEALRELVARGVSARLIIVGTAPMEAKLASLVEGLPVTMLGYISDRLHVSEILASADISLAPGPLETFCLSALESLASGTPVVASESSAVGELIGSNSSAGATAANSGSCFADAIEQLFARENLRSAARAAAENFPWSRTIETMLILHGALDQLDEASLLGVADFVAA